ncbi:MAG: hypothetical protein ACK4WB_03675 [Desulfatiglandales bacterium]
MCAIFFPLLIILQSCETTNRPSQVHDTGLIIQAAENFFVSLLKKDYLQTWGSITEKSRRTIISDVLKYHKGPDSIRAEIESDFREGKGAAISYWDAYVFHFDPNMALKDSKWEIGKVSGDYAEIILTYKKSERPAILKLYREGGAWRFGLVESFWSRK